MVKIEELKLNCFEYDKSENQFRLKDVDVHSISEEADIISHLIERNIRFEIDMDNTIRLLD